MKKMIIFFISLFIFPIICFASEIDFGAIKSENDPNGFNGIDWGTNKEELPDLVETQGGQTGFTECYIKRNKNLIVDGVDFGTIRYCFWQDKLFYIEAMTKDFENAEKLRDLFKAKYGEGMQTIEVPHGERFIYTWNGPKTIILLSCENNVMPYSGQGNLFMQSVEVEKTIDKYLKQDKE